MTAQQLEIGLEVVSDDSRDITRLVVQAAQYAEPLPCTNERRKDVRQPYPQVISATPLVDDTFEPAGKTITVIGRNLSSGGLDFFHDFLIQPKRVVVGLQSANACWSHLVLELKWTRFVQGGWYISGGKFTHVIAWPDPDSDIVDKASQRESF